ncbi:MAG: hypothetical protein L3J91_00930 [Thermoplasmata archaeon]|nr:hypothetical protein [Thermoplasmata archaeon]
MRHAPGRPILSPGLQRLLELDPTERFDLLLLNSLPFGGLVDEASEEVPLLESLKSRTEKLMLRVKTEEDDPLSAGAFLREQVLLWYRQSAEDPEWTSRSTERWAGLFADSRTTGGRLQPWLSRRMLGVYEACLRAGRLRSRIRRGLSGSKSVEGAVTRTALQQIQGESSQALLDDLASHPRQGEGPFPLVRLSELAVRRQIQTVNDALALLFNSHETGPFIVLHPNRYPDCEEVQIRPPTSTAGGAALAFLLIVAHPVRRGGGRGGATGFDGPVGEGGRVGGSDGPAEAFDGATIWEAPSVTGAAWRDVVNDYRKERKRLEAPPKDYRVRAAYVALREVLLEDAEFRKAFLTSKWRGRPAGLPLLVTLLQKGSIAPEVATDYEYLEAELGTLAADDPQWRPEAGVWTFGPWTVTREGSSPKELRYRAQRSP